MGNAPCRRLAVVASVTLRRPESPRERIANAAPLRNLRKRCEVCGKGFSAHRGEQKFCSPKCRWRAWERWHPRQRALPGVNDGIPDSASEPQCEHCGAAISPTRRWQRFCSDRCRRASWEARAADREAEKDRLKALAAAKCREEATIARWAALRVLGRYGVCTVSHVREYLEERGIHLSWALNWPGSLFQASPWFEPTGARRTTFHVEANARKVNEYRLSTEGREVLRSIRKVSGL